MGFEPLLSFDGTAAFLDLGKQFEAVIDSLTQTVLANAQANLGGLYPEAEATLRASLTSLAQTGLIEGSIGSDHWTAFLAEWGSGSEMDLSNTALAEYMASPYWNPLRNANDNAITGRAAGTYLGLDGLTHTTTGKLAGRNLEELRQYSWFQKFMEDAGITDPSAFMPMVPLHFMRDALESNRNLIIDQLNGVIETFGFGDFFV